MPKYRALHTKIIDSYDFAEMPDDFMRVFWMLLIVSVDREGRAIADPAWLRSKMFPLRSDVELSKIDETISWLSSRNMIVIYTVNGRDYFYIANFKTYQKGTEKEAQSVLPEPPELLRTNSGVSQEKVSAAVYVSASASVNESGGKIKKQSQFDLIPENLKTDEFAAKWRDWLLYLHDKKKTASFATQKEQLELLSKYTPGEAIKIIKKSISSGWVNVFDPTDKLHSAPEPVRKLTPAQWR